MEFASDFSHHLLFSCVGNLYHSRDRKASSPLMALCTLSPLFIENIIFGFSFSLASHALHRLPLLEKEAFILRQSFVLFREHPYFFIYQYCIMLLFPLGFLCAMGFSFFEAR
jgi:hypothetical protein